MVAPVTAAMLYDLVACPHRVTMDLFADPAERDEPNSFVELLWEKGSLYEREVIAGLQAPFLDLSPYAGDEKERLTLEAMQKGGALIYGGRIQVDGLLGDPENRMLCGHRQCERISAKVSRRSFIQTHNLKVGGSNPSAGTKDRCPARRHG